MESQKKILLKYNRLFSKFDLDCSSSSIYIFICCKLEILGILCFIEGKHYYIFRICCHIDFDIRKLFANPQIGD